MIDFDAKPQWAELFADRFYVFCLPKIGDAPLCFLASPSPLASPHRVLRLRQSSSPPLRRSRHTFRSCAVRPSLFETLPGSLGTLVLSYFPIIGSAGQSQSFVTSTYWIVVIVLYHTIATTIRSIDISPRTKSGHLGSLYRPSSNLTFWLTPAAKRSEKSTPRRPLGSQIESIRVYEVLCDCFIARRWPILWELHAEELAAR